MFFDNNQKTFLELVRAGLWEREARLLPLGKVDYEAVMRLAEEQSVVGLVTAGLEHVSDVKVPQEELLQFIGRSLQIESVNSEMNDFVWGLVEKMRKVGIYTLLVKGQGIAQCYERPLWRTSGDVDFLLSDDNYKKALDFLLPMASSHEEELIGEKHIGMTIDSWVVELHGTMPSRISDRADRVLKKVQNCVFYEGHVSSWISGKTTVFLLHPDEEVVFVFTHFLKHFFRGGIGLRQICDWCRLLWSKREMIDKKILASRLKEMRFMTEWKAFAALTVEVMGMPADAMPFYERSERMSKKAQLILNCVLEVGTFGQNREGKLRMSQPSFMKRKWMAFKYKMEDFFYHFRVFPLDSTRVLFMDLKTGIVSTIRHEG